MFGLKYILNTNHALVSLLGSPNLIFLAIEPRADIEAEGAEPGGLESSSASCLASSRSKSWRFFSSINSSSKSKFFSSQFIQSGSNEGGLPFSPFFPLPPAVGTGRSLRGSDGGPTADSLRLEGLTRL